MKKIFTLLLAALCITSLANAQQVAYNRPPQEIEELVLAVPAPKPVFNQDCSAVLYMWENSHIPLAEMPLDGLFLAGTHVNPSKYCHVREKGFHTLTLKKIPDGKEINVSGLPEGTTALHAAWSPSGKKIAIFNRESDGVYLYSASLEDGKATRISNRRINTVAKKFLMWVNDDDIITACVVEGVKTPVQGTPIGPIVQESLGKKERKRTTQGFLRDNFDVEAYNHYFTSQLVRISASGEKEIGTPAIYRTIGISPDRNYLMIYRVTEHSYTAGFSKFKAKTTIEDLDGNVVKDVKYRSHLSWRADKPATLTWVRKAKKGANYKNSVYEQEAPFTEKSRLVLRTKKPFEKIYWSNDNLALVVEKEKNTITISSFKPGNSELNTIVSYNSKNIYELPGEPIMVNNEYGRKVVWTNDKCNEVLFNGEGYTPNGKLPNLVLYKLDKGISKVLWKCKAPYYEVIIAAKDPAARLFITARESFKEQKNFYLSNLKKKSRVAISDFPLPYPALKGVKREVMRYKRADGVEMTSFVWLPAGYNAKRDGKLPILLWAYPHSYKNAEAAARPKFSFYTHPKISNSGGSMLFWLTQGYCVMEAMAMPLIPTDGNKKANETFIKQLTMNAEAAIDALEKAGYGDRNRVAIGGHSYGSFMTANLLAHTKLFKAGISRSGAFNRSLTPYGFQDESRNYWDANKLYQDMSPFNYAHKLSGALLLIHGSKDENAGTFTIQSERLFQALRGHNKYVRYVELPLDGHSYRIRENVLHYLYEANLWLDKYVKNADANPTDKPSDEEDNNGNKSKKKKADDNGDDNN